MNTSKKYLTELKELVSEIPFDIEKDMLISLCLSISRVADKKITEHINMFKENNSLKLSALQKNNVRNYILGLADWNLENVKPIEKNVISDEDILLAINLINKGIKRNKEKVLGTIKSRLIKDENKLENANKYKGIINDYEDNKNQLLIIKAGKDNSGTSNILKSIIDQEYENLANYHYLAIIFEDNSWHTISEIAIYCELFKKELNFGVFNKNKHQKIEEISDFIKNNKNIKFTSKIEEKILDFYSGVSYGFQFNDLIISDNDSTKVLLLQKIELDETILPCPDCMEKNVRGNSYPKILQRSFECQNPNCPSRSKIGRGKRFDYLNVKRNTYSRLDDGRSTISNDLLRRYRKDIFTNKNDIFDMLVQFFSWAGEKIKYIADINEMDIKNDFNRKINFKNLEMYTIIEHKELLFKSLLKDIISNIVLQKEKPTNQLIKTNFSIYEGNSSTILSNIPEKIIGAITSPPYYNAREYSQWPTLLCYLIDMAINSKSVFEKMQNETYYFYNIGDIVGRDNMFVASHMSNRRLMLGFYSILIFEMVGYKLFDNIIWDKGEVQSKRNSTENIFPSYIKPINCYEHILVFGKNAQRPKITKNILVIDTVKKINSKGENILGHTAPYPEKLVELIFPYLKKDYGYLLDPFLGSGTTVIAGHKNNYKTVGIEINNEYFSLASKRILSIVENAQKKLV